MVRMRLYDANKRLLCLTIRIILRAQGALKILISAPYWLINKTGAYSIPPHKQNTHTHIYTDTHTVNRIKISIDLLTVLTVFFPSGLPLIFRQDNGKTDAGGQFEEHELARSLSPLLFCYTDKEQPAM